MLVFKTTSPDETFCFGQQLSKLVSAGYVLCLAGDLGAGKTLLVQGLANGLEIAEKVTSPTFTILQVYEAALPLYHFDLYRLEHPAELQDIGFEEYIASDGVVVIEWPDKFPEELPDEYLWIEIKLGAMETERLLTISAQGNRYQRLCEELKICLF
jgi:tRNA threonylcarbamoyladenosine biosynthesis protein TsaE